MYTLTFTEEQMAVLDRALQEVPFKFAAPIVQSINEQIMKAQVETAEKATEATKKK